MVYRDERDGRVRTLVADLPLLAALVDHAAGPLTGALAVEQAQLAAARRLLHERGVLPHHAPKGAGETT